MPSTFDDAPVSVRRNATQNLGCVVAFCSLFVVLGLGLFLTMFVRPVIRMVQAQSWPAVTCRITASNISTHRSSKSTNYSFDPAYTYSVNGQQYVGENYSFGGKVQGSYNSRAALQSLYRVGSTTMCYVNPADPTDAVLNKGMTGDIWFGLTPLIFTLVGGIGVVFTRKSMRSANTPKADWQPKGSTSESPPGPAPLVSSQPAGTSVFDSGPFQSLDRGSRAVDIAGAPPASDGPVTLKANSSPVGRVFATLFATLFWNGIVSVFVVSIGREILNGGVGFFSVFMGLFMVPFVLIGIGIFIAFIAQVLALFNGRAAVTLSKGALRPGESVDIGWKLGGGLFQPQNIRVFVEAREEATYRRGTDTVTDRSVFFRHTLYESASGPASSARLALPETAMHSFESSNNKIVWVLTVHGEIRWWPDVKEEYKLLVKPAGPRA
jgi:hypothetical protein